ncbi:hypothetical protein V5O48_000104 [Marasmius crinis-equi]|uniref:Het-C-domain-containing protein n=1 Tax=Marasmius crinis-equi TaxID=585013 RepID=A0ABR3G223_9AGAR
MPSNTALLFLLVFIFAFCLSGNGVYAFGAGNIPSFAYMEGRAFRHGDIEDVLAELLKKGSGGFALASVIGKGGSKFGGLDIKRVYFGNWLRDYSQVRNKLSKGFLNRYLSDCSGRQAVDIAGLSKLPLQTIINLCMALGFLAHGYATNEFEVTKDRLGCYLPTEHIDNPKGYGDGKDPRTVDPRLRGPVDPRELEIDTRTGMKNYIANGNESSSFPVSVILKAATENGNWDTSKALVRRTLEQCIHLGRQQRAQGQKQDEYEAYRLLGQLLHTLEDYSAHSNFCELALISMGFQNVFTHVGDRVRIQAPNGKWVAPIVTGTFGSSDFIHSLLGEAGDHLASCTRLVSQASVTDLNAEMNKAKQKDRSGGSGGNDPSSVLRDLLFKIPGGEGNSMSRDMEGIERIRAQGQGAAGGKRPEDMSPQELHTVLWQVLTFRDGVVKKIEKTIEKIPGLGPLIEKLMDSISVFVFTTLEPFLKPILKTATTGLQSASGEVIDSHDQYEVFNDPHASDPTHSFLSKDHFNLILNEPAGHIAKVIVSHTVGLVVKAWDDNSMNVRQVTEDILECLFHPDFHNPNSKIQREMLQAVKTWVDGLGKRRNEILRRLEKEPVKKHDNIRLAGDGGKPEAVGSYAHNQGLAAQANLQGYLQQVPGVQQAQSVFGGFSGGGGGGGHKRDGPAPPVPGGYPGASSHSHPHSQSNYTPGPPVPGGGEASEYYGSQSHQSHGVTPSFPGGPGGHSSPAPSFPGGPGGGGYTPSYSSPPPSFPGSGGPPSFPGSGPPSFPDAGGYGGYSATPGGFAPPGPPGGGPGEPGFAPPSGFGFPEAHPNQPPQGGGGGGYTPNYGRPPGW